MPDDAELVRRLARLRTAVGPGRRCLVGIAGAPGAGKSTLAERLAAAAGAVVVPMDGFHRPSAELAAVGLLAVKGVPDSFDAAGFVALLRRLRDEPGPVRAPRFDRDREEPVADAIGVPAGALVIVEGNYLLLEDGPWAEVRPALDECWYLEVPEPVRVEWLVARHVRYGWSPEAARARTITGSDGDNARLVAATRPRADLVVNLVRSAE